MNQRRISKVIHIGNVAVGGHSPISVQSMCNTDTRDVMSTINQIKELEEHDCEIIRVAVPDMEAAESLAGIKKGIKIPLIADIHFDYRLALAALKAGVDGLRLNPGNIGDPERVKAVVKVAKERNVPIRIGVNAGSLPSARLIDVPAPSPSRSQTPYGHPGESEGEGDSKAKSPTAYVPAPSPSRGEGWGEGESIFNTTAQNMVEAAMEHVRILESLDFDLIKVSLKAFDVPTTIAAYQDIAQKIPYPLHIGITEAGTPRTGIIRSAVGIGALLTLGIGDTIRVSLTAPPVEEVVAGYEILKSLNLRQHGPVLVSCPSCGRTEVDLIPIAEAVQKELSKITKPIKVAVMGCAVNGPGEAMDADIGIACGKGMAILFKKGKKIGTVQEADFLRVLMEEVGKL